MSNDDFREGSREGKKKDDFFEQSNTRRSSTEEQRTCICLQFPEVTPEQLRKLKQILELAESIPEVLGSQQQNPTFNRAGLQNPVVALESSQDSMDATMELIRGSRIIVNAFKVDNIRNMHKRNPRKMIRKLMKLILGEETLKHSSPTGKNSWTPIPENVFIAVEKFVNANVAKKKYTVSHQEYRTVLTTYCATLRNPKPKASHMKIERKINFRNELKDDVKISLQESTDDQKNKHFESTQNENVEDEENDVEDKEENKLLEEEKDKRRKQHVSQEARRRKETKIQEPVALQEEPQRKSRETTKRSHDENGKVAGKLTAGSSTFKPKNQDTSYY